MIRRSDLDCPSGGSASGTRSRIDRLREAIRPGARAPITGLAAVDTLSVWPRAREIAEEYWQRIEAKRRISDEFRSISVRCRATLYPLPVRATASFRGNAAS